MDHMSFFGSEKLSTNRFSSGIGAFSTTRFLCFCFSNDNLFLISFDEGILVLFPSCGAY
jgi:hypothetical protein